MASPFRLAAEWQQQGAVLMAWPHPGTDWAPVMERAEPVFRALALAILASEDLIICCNNRSQCSDVRSIIKARAQGKKLNGRLHTAVARTNDTWARDFGPLTLTNGHEHQLLDPCFNAWGNKFDASLDNRVNQTLHGQGYLGRLPMVTTPTVMEGGALETDGAGTLLTTRHSLLNPNRNGDVTAQWMEARLAGTLGISRVLWLENGQLDGDDTDGHIDTLARFCSPGCILYQACDHHDDPHYPALRAMADELRGFARADGAPYELIPLPWPEPVHAADGRRLPATYANFLILNEAVLVPVYGVPQDEDACSILARCFPQRRIEAIQCRPLLEQGGSLHCLTMQLPPGAVPP